MHIAGFEKFTLLDYPGKMATVVFTPGCVFRCPFCHNPELVEVTDSISLELFKKNREEEFFDFLEKRKGKLDAVCITGGEPTLQKDLLETISRIRSLGFLIKLDTNGFFPDIVEKILNENVVDYWAMDIKHMPEKYSLATGVSVPLDDIKRSVSLLMKRAKEYEFRTTVVPGIHEEEDFFRIAEWIDGASAYYLQEFRQGKILCKDLQIAADTFVNLDRIQKNIQDHFGLIEIRR
ncbi:MAG: anaerobic ribonucleoside-triphosphate reductase activating protein [Candidatus Moraniibacteriota bacterium]|nr:MAG: anaerobic ribonucleoside-triphosphate reductase activating protein [Candidatus Moranbacteria bacterium]